MKIPNDNIIKINNFVGVLDDSIKILKKDMSFLKISDNEAVLLTECFKVLKKKVDHMKGCRSVSEIKEHIKVKKLLRDKE